MLTGTSNFSGSIFSNPDGIMTHNTNPKIRDYTAEFFGTGQPLSREKREELILRYAPLVKYVAGRLAMKLPPHVMPDDLISAGVIGLMDAIEKFDPAKRIRFKTYAEFRIRGAMLDELRSMDWVPRSVRKKASELEKTFEKLQKDLGRPPEDEELAKAMGLSMEKYYQLLDKTRNISFLDIDVIRKRMPDSSDDDLFDLIADDGESDPFVRMNLQEVKEILVNSIKALPEKERLVVSLYYYEQLTMREIGEIMGYTESRISQMHTKAMLKLRADLASIGDEHRGRLLT